jgi:hypothetical protein
MQPFFFSVTETFNGVQTVNVKNLPPEWGVTALHSNILAAAVELDGTDAPFIGGAAIQILDIAPSQNAVQVRVNVLFNSPVRFRLALVIWP